MEVRRGGRDGRGERGKRRVWGKGFKKEGGMYGEFIEEHQSTHVSG